MAGPICFQQAHTLLFDPWEAAEGRPSPARVFLDNVRTVSQEGAPDGEGDSAGHDPAAPASEGGWRKRGPGFLCDSWCPGSAGLRRDSMGDGGGVATSSIQTRRRPLSLPLRDPCAWIHRGDRTWRGPCRDVAPVGSPGAEIGEAPHGCTGGDDLLNFPPSVGQRHLSRVPTGASCTVLERLLVSAPTRQKLGANPARKVSPLLYRLALCCN